MEQSIKRIAIEEAFVTQEIADEWAKLLAEGAPREPGFRKMGETILADSPSTRLIHEQLIDLGAARIAHMDATGIAMQVLSITSPGVQVFGAELATALARQANDRLSAAVKAHPDRFAGLAAVAPQNPTAAALEIERAIQQLDLCGVLINSHTFGEYLDDQKYWEIFAAAEANQVPIYLHPRTPSPAMIAPFLDYGLYFAGWGFTVETATHALRLIMGGVFDCFPRLKIILGHMGEGLPYWLQRLDNRYLLQVKIGAVQKMPRLPSEYFKEHFVITTSGVCSPPALRHALDVLGSDALLFAADYPYESIEEAVSFLDSVMISDQERRKIYQTNAEKLFRLDFSASGLKN
ncbi:amidohydrolase family protein [Candidatus Synechococcus calcipolaris G9]|uniref:Amidohydrolase family protein n=1 Tax=Candidatus Synechococcus calcipolaris G9 TaxID=1497997 RepID=A0ABT6EWB5_9SYNE|nr:amidohydrolase family protein [Candidatus Synechococcus calcipolaris]MDG2989794.1 amidohydrolase family protein [Candidatus Synechococcus calcipolaris G9]